MTAVSPSSLWSLDVVYWNMSLIGMKFLFIRSLLSDNVLSNSDLPFRYIKSNACTITCNLELSVNYPVRLHIDRTWNGANCPVSQLNATTLESSTKLVIPHMVHDSAT